MQWCTGRLVWCNNEGIRTQSCRVVDFALDEKLMHMKKKKNQQTIEDMFD